MTVPSETLAASLPLDFGSKFGLCYSGSVWILMKMFIKQLVMVELIQLVDGTNIS